VPPPRDDVGISVSIQTADREAIFPASVSMPEFASVKPGHSDSHRFVSTRSR
jgi:hypothetical protein